MELRLYLDILKRRGPIIMIVMAAAIAVVAAAGYLIQPTYTAHTTMRVLLDVGVSDFILREDYNTRLLNTYVEVSKSRPILTEAIDRLRPRTSSLLVEDLGENLMVEVIPDTELILISVKDKDPVLARDLANTLASLLTEYAQDLYVGSNKSTLQIVEEQLAQLDSELEQDRQRLSDMLAAGASSAETSALAREIGYREDAYDRLLDRYELARLNESLRANSVTVIAPATIPNEPSNMLGLTDIALGLVAGLFGGIALVLVLENLDTRIHSSQQLEYALNAPVLGSVPKGLISPDSFGRDNGSGSGRSIQDAYHLLGINLLALRGQMQGGEGISLQTILVTSAVSHEGKSMVSTNLAQALAERGQTVFLIDGDLRRPTIAKTFDLQDNPGLSNLLTERTPFTDETFSQAIYPTEQPSLFVVGGGPKVSNPTGLLGSPSMEQLIDYLGMQSQVTLLDAPPVLGMADVSLLAPQVDGIVLVVRQAFSTRDSVREALKQLQATRARVLGFVFIKRDGKAWDY